MKKLMTATLVVAMTLGVCACTGANNGKEPVTTAGVSIQETTSMQSETTSATTSQEPTQSQQEAMMEATIRGLMTENLNCMYNIFDLNSLPIQGEMKEGEWIYPVDESQFASYAAFEDYIRSVFCQETADLYLKNYPQEGNPRYLNKDGKLYINKQFDGGKGYYVDWSNYTVSIDSISDTTCEFTVTGSVEWPADKPVKEDYPVKGSVVLENGKWLLSKMIH